MKNLAFALIACLLIANPARAAERPNVLWLTSEDHGPHMGCYGDELARTPNVDALAEKGMRFAHAWSVAPVCAPARTCIITGVYPSSSGGEHMRSVAPMPKNMKMFPQFLREAGYYCSNNVKEDYNLVKPGPVWDESSNKAHWRKRREGQPFFAVFNSVKSHESQMRTRPHKQIIEPANVKLPAYHPDTPEAQEDWAQYYDKVSEADADAGARLKELEADGLAEETIVFFYADHGSGMPRSKRWPGNSGLQVPFVVYFPEKWKHLAPEGYAAGGVSNRLISFVDLAPTLLGLAGIKPPDWMQGLAFAGEFQTPAPEFRFGGRARMDERLDLARSVTDGRYVYIRNYMPHLSTAQHVAYQFMTPTTRVWRKLFDEGKTNAAQSQFWTAPRSPEELYDLETDPDEVNNLAGSTEHRATLEKLRAAHRKHVKEIRDLSFLPEADMHERSKGGSPYAMARDEDKYPFDRILATAELAANFDNAAIPKLIEATNDADGAVRYWGALGLRIRGKEAVTANRDALTRLLSDDSPNVRIVAAEALAQFGDEKDIARSLQLLIDLAPMDKNGAFTSVAALNAIDALGNKAAPLAPGLRKLNVTAANPYGSYGPRLVEDILAKFDAAPGSKQP